MTQEIKNFLSPSTELLAFGEPTHQAPAFGYVRNKLFAELAGHGFRSIALETDRVAGLVVDDFVRAGVGTLDTAMSDGFSHGSGELDTNRQLVAWMREYNDGRPAEDQLAFHGFDASTENYSADSPRVYLEYARDYLGLDLDLKSLIGDDEQWNRTEAILDAAKSVGNSPEAAQLRVIADDLLVSLYSKAPELVAATSRADWYRAHTNLSAGLGLLRYHRQAAKPMELGARIDGLMAARDALMAQNLLDLRSIEAERGPTFVCAHNFHLQRNSGIGAGAIVGSLLGNRYSVVIGSLGRSQKLGLNEPEPDTFEGSLQRDITSWALTRTASGRTRTDTKPEQGYFPLEQETVDLADAILHINEGSTTVS
jgi:erythromycin esterase-like protein